MLYNTNFTDLRRRVYQYYKNFKKFQSLNDSDFDRIQDSISYLNGEFPIDKYMAMLKRCHYTKTLSYDEKIASLIIGCDPHLFSLSIFEELGSPEKGTEEYALYEQKVRDQISIFDGNFKYYEAYYRRRKEQLVQEKINDKDVKTLSKKQ